MLTRFMDFPFHLFSMTLLSTEKTDSNIQTNIPWLKFSPNLYINKRFKCMRSISTGRSSYRRWSVKTGVLKNFGNSQKNINCLFNKNSRLGLEKVLSCECCKIFKNTFYTRHLRKAASSLAHLVEKLLGQIMEWPY